MSWCLIKNGQVVSSILSWDSGLIADALHKVGVSASPQVVEPTASFSISGVRLSKMTDPTPPQQGMIATTTAVYVVNGEGVIAKSWALPPAPSQDELIQDLWVAADAHFNTFDINSQTALLSYAIDPSCPSWRRSRIGAVMAWGASVWDAYAVAKAAILAGTPTVYDPSIAGPCPYTIWQIRSE
jgi:hypothetical protein